MQYDNVTTCVSVPVLPDEIISEIEKRAGIKNLAFIIAIGQQHIVMWVNIKPPLTTASHQSSSSLTMRRPTLGWD